MQPPVAPIEPQTTHHHGVPRVDPYAWMADTEDSRLRDYLVAENAYARSSTTHLQDLTTTIRDEITARTRETDLSVPVLERGWWYYARSIKGYEHPIHARLPASEHPVRPELDPLGPPPPGEQVVLDVNAEAQGADAFSLGSLAVSLDGHTIAFTADRSGQERFDVVVRDLRDGRDLDTGITGVGDAVLLAADGRHVLHLLLDDTERPWALACREIGGTTQQIVHSEPDERFFLSAGLSRDERWILITSASKTTSETWLLDAADPLGEARLVAPRAAGVLYDVDPAGDGLLIVHNRDRINFEVAWAAGPGAPWQPLAWSTPDELVLGTDVLDRWVLLTIRRHGRPAVRIVPREGLGFGQPWDLEVPGDPGVAWVGEIGDSDTDTIPVGIDSLATPAALLQVHLHTREWTVLRRRPVPGFDTGRLRESRLWATADDGTRVPVTLVHHESVRPDGSAPCLVYGYGAYGAATDPWFSVARLSLLQRGVVFAIAHVRGGTDLGWDWYEQGRLERKPTSFTDFVAVADALVEHGWAAPGRLGAWGASAGGWLVAAAALHAPDRFAVVHAEVPFVDPLTSMLDPDLPLTVTEREEWGDPLADPAAYQRLAAWSPYEQAGAHGPHLLVTTGVNDTRVLVTEPAKWVARLRAEAIEGGGDRRILLRTELEAGHSGVTGRYDAWDRIAWEWAVLLDWLGVSAAAEGR